MLRLLNLTTLSCLTIASFIACSSKKEITPHRQDKPAYEQTKTIKVVQLEKLKEPLLGPTISACKKVQQLAALDLYKMNNFSFLSKIKNDEAAIDISQSPFVQMTLSEKFEMPNVEEFLQLSKDLYESGQLPLAKWLLIKSSYKTNIGYNNLRYSSMNKIIAGKYPGIYGTKNKYKGSIYDQLLQRISIDERAIRDSWRYRDYLTAKLPLFFSESWNSLSAQSLFTMSSAVQGLINTDKEITEPSKLCSLVLLQRSFAQLLRIRGHYTPEFDNSGAPKLYKLSLDENPKFVAVPIEGSFINSRGENKVLQDDQVFNYDPYVQKLSLVEITPSGKLSRQSASLTERISYFQSLVNYFQATSPASPWVGGVESYYIGDIENSLTALLPYEAHSLTLGLITMALKDLNFDSIHEVNAQGAIPAENEPVAGIMLARLKVETTERTVKLMDVLKLAKAVVRFDHALDLFKNRPHKDWEAFHPIYKPKFLAELFGTGLFTEDELNQLYPDGSFNDSKTLSSKLKSLQLHMAHLIDKFTAGNCMSLAKWHPKTGELKSLKECSEAIKVAAVTVKNLIARHLDKPDLWTPETDE